MKVNGVRVGNESTVEIEIDGIRYELAARRGRLEVAMVHPSGAHRGMIVKPIVENVVLIGPDG